MKNKYQPERAPNRVELKQEFANSKLKCVNQDPDEWITKLEVLQADLARMKLPIMDKDLFIHILNNLPKEYDMEVKLLENKLSDTVNPLTLQMIQEELSLRYMRMYKQEKKDDDE